MSQVVRETALIMQEYTQSGGVRPFGVSCLVAGFDDDGPQLFQVDPEAVPLTYLLITNKLSCLLTYLLSYLAGWANVRAATKASQTQRYIQQLVL